LPPDLAARKRRPLDAQSPHRRWIFLLHSFPFLRDTRPMRTIVKLVVVLAIVAAVFYGAVVALDPWALHIGGRSTPLLYWTGMGTLTAKDGRTYPLYVYFHPDRGASRLHVDGLRPNSGLGGTAKICTAPGKTELLKLSGTMYGGYRSTDGSLMGFRLIEFRVINPTLSTGFFDLMGGWQGAELVLNRPNQQGHVFPSGLRVEAATVTLHYATRDDFAACQATK